MRVAMLWIIFLLQQREQYPDKRFFKIEMGELIEEKFDFVLASGVFNFLYSEKETEHRDYVLRLFPICLQLLIKFYLLTSYLHL